MSWIISRSTDTNVRLSSPVGPAMYGLHVIIEGHAVDNGPVVPTVARIFPRKHEVRRTEKAVFNEKHHGPPHGRRRNLAYELPIILSHNRPNCRPVVDRQPLPARNLQAVRIEPQQV